MVFHTFGCAAGLMLLPLGSREGAPNRDVGSPFLMFTIPAAAFISLAFPATFKVFEEEEHKIESLLLFLVAESELFTSISVWHLAFDIKGYVMSD